MPKTYVGKFVQNRRKKPTEIADRRRTACCSTVLIIHLCSPVFTTIAMWNRYPVIVLRSLTTANLLQGRLSHCFWSCYRSINNNRIGSTDTYPVDIVKEVLLEHFATGGTYILLVFSSCATYIYIRTGIVSSLAKIQCMPYLKSTKILFAARARREMKNLFVVFDHDC